eukprot:749789-Hanusia_phi.AAC.1
MTINFPEPTVVYWGPFPPAPIFYCSASQLLLEGFDIFVAAPMMGVPAMLSQPGTVTDSFPRSELE